MEENTVADVTNTPEGFAVPETAPTAEVENSAQAETAPQPETAANGEPSDPPPEPEAKPKPKAADRIREVIAERNYWREKAMAVPAKEEKQAPSAPPTLEQHGFDTEKWAQAYTQYHEQRSAQVVREELTRREQQQQAVAIQEQFAQREAAFSAAQSDYTEAVTDPSLAQYVTPTIAEVIVASDLGPQLSYHLATHRDELARISRLSPSQQAAALGRLEVSIATPRPAPAKPKPVQQTRAPAPPSPVGGNQGAPVDPAKIPTADEWMKWRQADLAAKRKQR